VSDPVMMDIALYINHPRHYGEPERFALDLDFLLKILSMSEITIITELKIEVNEDNRPRYEKIYKKNNYFFVKDIIDFIGIHFFCHYRHYFV
jgi:hypothetical protein